MAISNYEALVRGLCARRRKKERRINCSCALSDNDRAVTPVRSFVRSLVGNYGLIIKRDDRQQAEQNRQRCRRGDWEKIGWRRGRKDGWYAGRRPGGPCGNSSSISSRWSSNQWTDGHTAVNTRWLAVSAGQDAVGRVGFSNCYSTATAADTETTLT